MSNRRPSDLVRENTEPKPEIHEERNERAAQLEEARQEAFLEETSQKPEELQDEA